MWKFTTVKPGIIRFNRYMVECEFSLFKYLCLDFRVLIDTWWNVNVSSIKKPLGNGSFNRYMVECEYQF